MILKKGFEFIDNIEELSAMPTIALDLMGMLNDPSSSVRSIVEKVQLDQAMSSYILKNCNSPLYGVRTEVTSITRAVNMLGFSTLKAILMSYFMRNLYQLSGKNAIKDFLWKHSIAVAVFSKILAPWMGFDQEEAYMAGLLHDIGKMVLYLNNPKDYEKIIKEIETHNRSFIEVENAFFEFNHQDAGYYLLEKWKFSELLKSVVHRHHDEMIFTGKDKIVGLVGFADTLYFTYLSERMVDLQRFIDGYGISQATIDKVVEEALQKIETYHAIV